MIRYKKDLDGLLMNIESGNLSYHKFFVQYTSDKQGRSLSISNDETGDMFMIPFDELYKVIAKEVKKK